MALRIWKGAQDKDVYLSLEDISGAIVLVAVNQKGDLFKNILVITPEGVRLTSHATNAGIRTDPQNKDRIHLLEG